MLFKEENRTPFSKVWSNGSLYSFQDFSRAEGRRLRGLSSSDVFECDTVTVLHNRHHTNRQVWKPHHIGNYPMPRSHFGDDEHGMAGDEDEEHSLLGGEMPQTALAAERRV